ncbi:MAG: hypothetical protein A2161_21730 [Candidatus Schekmanbacteria bacterium RBG_13_48_7]|uniref:Phage-Barnase-EndoU-ColicinE5/D-RelE like nuclease 2 domain-containing protein n=1 Tax=Candidatus Schekmanbacteria bacterium RBG_13_48_7 TaxID=1817878 RepID=A0A1F7RRC7_9BACT|nr:MAG: hypothetical protein A2161_21730 [Candidatus Schekmanbacteria bacterium RBG_13_48_7]
MIIMHSKNKIPFRLTAKRWYHIIEQHPEILEQREKVIETITDPDLILEGDCGELIALKFYSHTPLTQKYLSVVYKELSPADGFILTAYFTNQSSNRMKVLWKR